MEIEAALSRRSTWPRMAPAAKAELPPVVRQLVALCRELEPAQSEWERPVTTPVATVRAGSAPRRHPHRRGDAAAATATGVPALAMGGALLHARRQQAAQSVALLPKAASWRSVVYQQFAAAVEQLQAAPPPAMVALDTLFEATAYVDAVTAAPPPMGSTALIFLNYGDVGPLLQTPRGLNDHKVLHECALDFPGFVHFATDFGLLPRYCSKFELACAFIAAAGGDLHDGRASATTLHYAQYVEAVARLAVIAFSKPQFCSEAIRCNEDKVRALAKLLDFHHPERVKTRLRKRTGLQQYRERCAFDGPQTRDRPDPAERAAGHVAAQLASSLATPPPDMAVGPRELAVLAKYERPPRLEKWVSYLGPFLDAGRITVTRGVEDLFRYRLVVRNTHDGVVDVSVAFHETPFFTVQYSARSTHVAPGMALTVHISLLEAGLVLGEHFAHILVHARCAVTGRTETARVPVLVRFEAHRREGGPAPPSRAPFTWGPAPAAGQLRRSATKHAAQAPTNRRLPLSRSESEGWQEEDEEEEGEHEQAAA